MGHALWGYQHRHKDTVSIFDSLHHQKNQFLYNSFLYPREVLVFPGYGPSFLKPGNQHIYRLVQTLGALVSTAIRNIQRVHAQLDDWPHGFLHRLGRWRWNPLLLRLLNDRMHQLLNAGKSNNRHRFLKLIDIQAYVKVRLPLDQI